jgi:hypothetical protein
MSATAARHAGLPFVPQPASNELLGSWLLRVAQLYGLGLRTLLRRLGTLQPDVAHLPHWFAIDANSVSLNALSAAARLSRVDLAAMAPSGCRPRWPGELGVCERCLADAKDTGQPLTWNRNWMSPLATVCNIHGTWLTPIAIRTLAGIRHAGDIARVIQHVAVAQRPAAEAAYASDALWLQDQCTARTVSHAPWGRIRPQELIGILDAVAREVVAASGSGADSFDPQADRQQATSASFALALGHGERVGVSLPTQLRHRQWLLARVAHVLRWPPDERACFKSWPAASIKRLASMRNGSAEVLTWICPPAAELVRQQDSLQRELGISPRYFKACSALFDSIR